jgi:tetratricopeptide (TPR) repeat protein
VEPSEHARHIEVEPLSQDESLELIRYKQLTWPHLGITFPRELIPASAAKVLARTVGGYPLAIELAAGWVLDRLSGLRQDNEMVAARAAETVAEFVAEFDREAAALNRRAPGAPAHPLPYQVTVKLAMGRLLAGAGGEAGRRVLRMCAFLSPDGVEVDPLHSPAMCDELAGQGVGFHYPLLVDAVLWAIDRYGLAAVSFARGGRLKMHRVVAEFVRADMTAAQEETPAETERTAIYRVLAAYQPPATRPPTGSDQAMAWDQAVVETSAHIDAKYAAAGTEPAVRRWVVDQVHRLVEVADKSAWERARQIGDECARSWEPDSDALLSRPERPDDSVARRLLIKVDLLVELAEACRKLGSYDQALGHIRRAWQWQRRILRDPHPQLWVTMSRYAMILRARGDFQEAFGWDERAVKNLRDLLGADHHTTGRVLNNLAASMHLNGDYTAALELAKERFERTRRVAGEDDDDAWWTAVNIAGTLRCLGKYDDAYLLLKRALGRLVRREKEPFGTRSLDRLRIEHALAVTERGLGKVSESRSRNAEVLEQYRRLLGDDDMLTLRSLAGVAADLHAQGDHAGAVERARDCYERFDRTLPGHPFTYMCQANLAVYLRAEGQRLDDALAHGEQSRSGLAERLGEWHPVTLAAIVNHASTQLLVNGPQAALDLERVACERLQWLFGAAETRDLRIARDNMRNTLAHLGSKAPRVRARHGTPVDAEEPPDRRDIEIEVPGY